MMMKHKTLTTMLSIPQDLIMEILPKLPVKSLLRFKSVCKSWKSIITDPQFARLHSGPARLLIKCNGVEYHSVDCEALVDNCGYDKAIVKLQFPIKDYGWLPILASCNGLICFGLSGKLYVWNPSTGDFKQLRKSSSRSLQCGLGYDKSIDDYKVVVIGYTGRLSLVDVLTLRTNTWRRTQDFNYCFGVRNAIFVNGALHWEAYSDSTDGIISNLVAFDLAEETSRIIPIPEYERISSLYNWLGVLGGCLCLCCKTESGVDVWIMKEYGVKESWMKLISIPSQVFKDWNLVSRPFRPLVYCRDGGIVGIINNKILVKCNLNNNSFQLIKTYNDGKFNIDDVIVYEESLVSPR
ncbi:F-box/kelch-repeat protein At3g23880-like [Hevea brasiliensis]|nr:F-box/kelch-repeat protein At3g23880-like [Hevea brasiliensis]